MAPSPDSKATPQREAGPPLEVRPPFDSAERDAAFEILHQLRPDVPVSEMNSRVESMRSRSGYRLLIGLDEAGSIVAVAGIRPDEGLSRGPHLRVDDIVVCSERRGRGFGRSMLAAIAEEARRLGFPRILLDARHDARGFYDRLGFAFREAEPCMIDVDRL